jgi:hypothetical protein
MELYAYWAVCFAVGYQISRTASDWGENAGLTILNLIVLGLLIFVLMVLA